MIKVLEKACCELNIIQTKRKGLLLLMQVLEDAKQAATKFIKDFSRARDYI